MTHHHEEHSGNLNWLGERLRVPLYVGEATARILQAPPLLPRIRRWMIGQPPPPLEQPHRDSRKAHACYRRRFGSGCRSGPLHDHIVLYDRSAKLLIAGDTFIGVYFVAPNPDVDSLRWIETLRRLLELDIEILVEGHGFIHTLRVDVPDIPGLVIRRNPRDELLEKLRFFESLREQIESGLREGLPLRAVKVSCFPWGRSSAWEQFASDELARILNAGHWSRTGLVRVSSALRPATPYSLRCTRRDSGAAVPASWWSVGQFRTGFEIPRDHSIPCFR